MNKILWWLGFSILAGILGRMGGAGKPYKTWMRDWIIPVIFTGLMVWQIWRSPSLWLVGAYSMGFLALGGSLSTYWDWLFGFDNLWFSGLMVGLSAFPYEIILHHWVGFSIRAIVLAVIWGCLNTIKYDRILIWRRDVAEENLRYISVILTMPLLLI